MSSQRSVSHSTGPGRTAYPEDDLTSLRAASSSLTESSRSRSLSSEDGGWHDVLDDDIEPSDSVSRPPTASSTEAQSRRRRSRHQNSRPVSLRRKSSARVPTIPEESHRSHGSYSDRRDRYTEEENSHHIRPREHRVRVPSSGSTTSSVESNEYHMGGGPHYDQPHHPYPQYPPYLHAPQPPQSNYPPTVISSHHGHDAYGHGRTMPPYDAMVHMPRQDPLSPYGYNHAGNPFATGPPSSNPFSPIPSNVSAADDYFNPYSRQSPHGGPHHPHAIGRPPPPSRPLSYAGSPYPMDALAHYHQPPLPYSNDPRIIAQHLYELNRANKSHSASPEPSRSAKSKSPAPAAAPPPPVEPVKEAPKEDQAEILIKLLAKHEADKQAAAEEKAKKEAEAAAAEKAKKDAENTESAKIAAMLQKWEEERQKREAEEKAAAAAAKKAAEEKAAKEAEIAALILAAKEAANTEAAAKAKAAEEEAAAKTKAIEEEAAAKTKAIEEESAKAVAAAKAAAEEAEKARKEAEEAVAKAQPSGEDEKACIHFHDAMGRRYDLPWKFAKTFKGMEGLIKQAHSHIAVVRKNIDAGRYDLIGPDDNIILHQVWEMFVQPGWEVKIEIWPDPPEEPAKEPAAPLPPPMIIKNPSNGKPHKKLPKRTTVPAISDDDPIVEIIDGNAPPKTKPKKKPAQSAFSAWMLGTRPAPSRKPAGKDSEKLEMGMVHYVSNGSGNAHGHAHAQTHVRARSNSNHRNSEDYYMVGRGNKSTALPSVSQGKAAHVDERTVEVPCSVM